MKKIFSIFALILAASTFVACSNEEDDIFSQSAAERLNAASDLYSSRLTAQPNGWAMQLYPTTQNKAPYGTGYLVLMRFHPNHQVDVAMNNLLTNNVYQSDSSVWDVITDDGPVLSFDTHNSVMHKFSDPDDVPQTGTSNDANDETGTGIGGDFEYIIVDAPEDASYMMLKGKKRGTYNLLTPIEVGVDYESYLSEVNGFMADKFSSSYPNGALLILGDSIFHFDGASDGVPSIYGLDADEVTSARFNPFVITKRGNDFYLRFRDALTVGADSTEQEFKYDSIADKFYGVNDTTNAIAGYYKARFVGEQMNNGHRFQVTSNSEMGPKVRAALDQVISDFRDRRFTFQNINIQKNDSSYQFVINWRQNRNARASRVYGATVQITGNESLNITYTGETNSAGEQLLSVVPSVRTLFETLAGSFNTAASISNFNLTQIRFVSTTDPDVWYDVNYN